MSRRKWKEHSFCVVFIVICIAVGVLFNAVVDMLADRYTLTIDMTENGIYQLSDQTVQTVSQISGPVTIYALMKEADFSTRNFYAQVNELLQQYKIAGKGNIELKYVDVYSDPGFMNRYQDISLAEGSLIVERGDRYRGLLIDDLYQIQYDPSTGQTFVQGIQAEQKITSAILYVMSTDDLSVCLLQGHGEQYSNQISSLFENSGYEIARINLTTDDIPPETALLVMSGPTIDYTERELDKLDGYLASGGDMMVFSSVYAGETTLLDRYFESWGVRFESNIVIDQKNCLPNNPLQIYGTLADGPIAEEMQGRSGMPLLAPGCRPLTVVGRDRVNWSVTPLAYSSSAAYSKPMTDLDDDTDRQQTEKDAQGPFILAAMAQHEIGDGSKSRIVFIGSHLITSDSLLSEPSWLNGSFLTACVNLAGERGDIVTVTPKQMTTNQLVLSNASAKTVFWVSVVFIPACILAAGLFRWRRRRNR